MQRVAHSGDEDANGGLTRREQWEADWVPWIAGRVAAWTTTVSLFAWVLADLDALAPWKLLVFLVAQALVPSLGAATQAIAEKRIEQRHEDSRLPPARIRHRLHAR
jgi:hypothetical protein